MIIASRHLQSARILFITREEVARPLPSHTSCLSPMFTPSTFFALCLQPRNIDIFPRDFPSLFLASQPQPCIFSRKMRPALESLFFARIHRAVRLFMIRGAVQLRRLTLARKKEIHDLSCGASWRETPASSFPLPLELLIKLVISLKRELDCQKTEWGKREGQEGRQIEKDSCRRTWLFGLSKSFNATPPPPSQSPRSRV